MKAIRSARELSAEVTAARALAGIRVVLLVAIVLSERAESPLDFREAVYDVLIVAAAVWSLVLLALALTGRKRGVEPVEAIVDLALLGGLTYATGGAFSPVRQAFFVVPVIAAATQTPARTALWGLAAPAVFTVSALVADVGDLPGWSDTIVTGVIFMLAIAVAAVLASLLLRERRAEALEHAERGRLLAQQLLEVRDTERRELAHGLHDHPVQLLGAARIEIGTARAGDPDALDRLTERVEGAEAALRETAFELHPYALDELGLCEAVRRVAEAECRRAGMELRLHCPPLSPGPHDEQLFAIARELVSNAARHSNGTYVEVSISEADREVLLLVSDDGIGIDPVRRREALRGGHLGLISVKERARAMGGEITVTTSPENGTFISIRAPG